MWSNVLIFDIETEGLKANKLHVFAGDYNGEKVVFTSRQEVRDFLLSLPKNTMLVGHNIFSFDLPALVRLLNLPKSFFVENFIVYDTLLASYMYDRYRNSRSLASYGLSLGIEKVVVNDWIHGDKNLYIERCVVDVEITKELFKRQIKFLKSLGNNLESFINYLSDKAKHLYINYTTQININMYSLHKNKMELEFEINLRLKGLKAVMQTVKNRPIIMHKPKKIYRKDGSLSVLGKKWFDLLRQRGIPEDSKIEAVYEDPNPLSVTQLKEWLFSLGWEPDVFKENDKGEKIPQVSKLHKKELSDSVLRLAEKHKAISLLDGLYKLRHRLGILKSIETAVNGGDRLHMEITGLTRTFRLRHKVPIVNLPKEKLVRSLFVAPKGYVLIGADISGLEDRTKQHYIYPFDPEYVKSMQSPGFDPHLDIAVLANLMTKEQSEKYKQLDKEGNYNEEYEVLKKLRSKAKTTNFAATYGASPAKIADTLKIQLEEAEVLYKAYWDRNKAIKEFESTLEFKLFRNKYYVLNPLSGIWMPLKERKDAFSAVNQSTGVYVFDTWVKNILKEIPGALIWLQYHDEIGLVVREEEVSLYKQVLERAIKKTNEELNLNVYIPIDVKVGKNYYEIH